MPDVTASGNVVGVQAKQTWAQNRSLWNTTRHMLISSSDRVEFTTVTCVLLFKYSISQEPEDCPQSQIYISVYAVSYCEERNLVLFEYQEPMTRSKQLPYWAYVTAFLLTDLFLDYLFRKQKKAVPVW